MNWLFPGFLAGALCIALPVALHFLRRKTQTVVRFPSLRFLGESALRDTRRHQLRRWLTLLLRCLAIALLAAAFARPFWPNNAARPRQAMVIALDNSMSMSAAGRWEKLRAWAGEQLAALNPGDRVALLVLQPNPTRLVPMTDNLDAVKAALENARPGFEKTRYPAAVRLAGEILAAESAREKTIVWVADEQRAGWVGMDFKLLLPPAVKFRFADVQPVPARQAAVVSVQKLTGEKSGLAVVVRQFQPSVDHRQLKIKSGNVVLAEQMLALRNGDNPFEIPCAWPTNAPGLRVELDADDLPADDVAWIAAGKSSVGTIWLDGVAGSDFLAHALRSTEKLSEGAFKTEALPDTAWPADAVVVLRGTNWFGEPKVQQLDRFFDAGGALWVFADGSPEQNAWLAKHGVAVKPRRSLANEPWRLRDWDSEHPALGAFAGQSLLPLLDVEFNRGFDLAGDAVVSVANWPDGKAALAEVNLSGRRLFIAGFPMDREATDWPSHPSFVPFVHQTVRWLAAAGPGRSNWRVGDVIPLPAQNGTLRSLDAAAAPEERSVGATFRADVPGLYEFSGGGVRQVFAVNILPEESDLAPWPNVEQFAGLESKEAPAKQIARAEKSSRETSENQQRLWWWCFAMCGLVALAELALANRTST